MLRDIAWPKTRDYKSAGEHEPVEFYLSALKESTSFDLQLGYFSSAAIHILSLGFAKFISNGGRMRMVINDVLSTQDKEVLIKVEEGHQYQVPFNIQNFEELKAHLDEYDLHFFQCLGYLIQNSLIEIKIIKPSGRYGISHYKAGIFSDGADKVGFSGSCNFTYYGLLQNLERLEAFLSWDDARSEARIESLSKDFDELFLGNAKHVEYLDAKQITTAIATHFGNSGVDELLIQEQQLNRAKQDIQDNRRLKKVFDKAKKEIQISLDMPRFPYPEGPRPYQIEAYNKWIANGKKGVFAMATGTGKTLTSLNCLLNEYKELGLYRSLILVPTVALLEQWKKECEKFNFRNIITVSSKAKWNESISFFNTAARMYNASYIIIVTYASFVKKKFQSSFASLPDNTLLIADEVHNMGASGVAKLLDKVHLHKRIGLSATPNRKYDEGGNAAIEGFFNDQPPFVYSYSMRKALESGWLCQYTYYPHIVSLTEEELEEYIKISKQLLRYLDPITKGYKNCKEVEFLLLARKRIIHKAQNKKGAFRSILNNEFQKRGNLKYTLVYVPEGVEPNYEETDADPENDAEDAKLINEYTKAVSQTDASIMVKQYTANTKDRETVIKSFEQGLTHVLTSMKCLDEGVDVPRSELAIFCASTGNPRQFIQRRGRVLRLHKDKTHSVIHDLVVVPIINNEDSTYEMERNLVKKEIERVVDFSELSLNSMDTYNSLSQVLGYYNINLTDFYTEPETL